MSWPIVMMESILTTRAFFAPRGVRRFLNGVDLQGVLLFFEALRAVPEEAGGRRLEHDA